LAVVGDFCGEIVCFLSLFKASIFCFSEKKNAYYVYGVCTKSSFRSQGLSKRLLSFAQSNIENADCLVLIPANSSLFDFYANQGFEKFFYLYEKIFTVYPKKEINFSLCEKNNFAFLREQLLQKQSFSAFISDVDIVYDEIIFLKGSILTTIYKDVEYYIVCYLFDDYVFVKEHNMNDNYHIFLPSIAECFGKNKIKIRGVPNDSSSPYGMIKMLNDFEKPNIGYMNLMLD
jgi:hypothetical protein